MGEFWKYEDPHTEYGPIDLYHYEEVFIKAL